jgi:PEP-CTERM motif
LKKKVTYFIAGMLTFSSVPAMAASVVYSSIPDLNGNVSTLGWCSSCGTSNYQYLDPFTLSSGATITGFNLSKYIGGSYQTSNPLVFQIWNSSRSAVLFSTGSIAPTFFGPANGSSNTAIVTGSFSPITLSAGSYYASFVGTNIAINGYAGGNGGGGQLSQVGGGNFEARGDNIGYQLLGTSGVGAVPEPSTWALMLLGFGAIGFAMRKASKVRTTVSYA